METNIDYLHRHFANLYKGQGKAMAMFVTYTFGNGLVLITKDEWKLQNSIPKQKALIKSRLEALYRKLKKDHDNAPE